MQRVDDGQIRASAVQLGIPRITARAGISAVVSALSALHAGDYAVNNVQSHHKRLAASKGARTLV